MENVLGLVHMWHRRSSGGGDISPEALKTLIGIVVIINIIGFISWGVGYYRNKSLNFINWNEFGLVIPIITLIVTDSFLLLIGLGFLIGKML